MYFLHIRENLIVGASEVQVYSEDISCAPVDEETYRKYTEDKDSVIIDEEGNIVDNPYLEEIHAKRREDEFNKEFFLTSVGYIRRKARNKDGTIKDFITDLVPLMEGKENIPIIVYDTPDFTAPVTEEILISLQKVVKVTPELLEECKEQAIIDFYGFNPLKLELDNAEES